MTQSTGNRSCRNILIVFLILTLTIIVIAIGGVFFVGRRDRTQQATTLEGSYAYYDYVTEEVIFVESGEKTAVSTSAIETPRGTFVVPAANGRALLLSETAAVGGVLYSIHKEGTINTINLHAQETTSNIHRSLSDFALSPDGKYLVYLVTVYVIGEEDRRDVTTELWVSDSDGKNARKLADSTSGLLPPDGDRAVYWGADGRSIYLSVRDPLSKDRFAIQHYVLMTGAFITMQLPNSTTYTISAPQVSPDDTSIAYDTNQDNGRISCLELQDMTTGTTSELPDTCGNDSIGIFRWSPDGTSLFFTRELTEEEIVYILDRTNGSVKTINLPPPIDNGDAYFSSRLFHWTSNNSIVVLRTQGTPCNLRGLLTPEAVCFFQIDDGGFEETYLYHANRDEREFKRLRQINVSY